MFGSMFTILLALLLLSFLIFIHELAHFLAGKWVGIHAEAFSIGFGPPLLRFARKGSEYRLSIGWRDMFSFGSLPSFEDGGTEYRLSMIPAGGYVRFPGEYSEDEERLESEFHQAPVWRRLIVVAAGPLSNLVLGAVLYAAIAAGGIPSDPKPIIGEVPSPEEAAGLYWDDPTYRSPAAQAGIQPGDRVLEVNGRKVETWSELTQEVMLHPDKPTHLKLTRGGEEMEIEVTPQPVLRGNRMAGQIGVRLIRRMAAYGEDGAPREIVSIGGESSALNEALRGAAQSETEIAFADGSSRRFRVSSHAAVLQVSSEQLAAAGVLPGSYLTEIDGSPIRSAADVWSALLEVSFDNRRWLTFDTNGSVHTVEAELPLPLTIRVAGIDEERNPDAGALAPGDSLHSVNGLPVSDYDGVRASIEKAHAAGKPSRFEFQRNFGLSSILFETFTGGQLETEARIDENGRVRIPGLSLSSNWAENPTYLELQGFSVSEQYFLTDPASSETLAVGSAPPETERYGPIESIGKGVAMTGDSVMEIVSILKRLFTGEVSTKHLSGPVGIVNVTQRALEGGWTWATFYTVLKLMALISVNLAIVNLLPIPVADGGQILFFLYEGLRGRPLNLKLQTKIQMGSLFALIGLMAVITVFDIW